VTYRSIQTIPNDLLDSLKCTARRTIHGCITKIQQRALRSSSGKIGVIIINISGVANCELCIETIGGQSASIRGCLSARVQTGGGVAFFSSIYLLFRWCLCKTKPASTAARILDRSPA
jgi:hypothetical protein